MGLLNGISLGDLRLALGLGVSLLAISGGLVCGLRVVGPAILRLWTQPSDVLLVAPPGDMRPWHAHINRARIHSHRAHSPSAGITYGVALCYPLLATWFVAMSSDVVVSCIASAGMVALAVLGGVLPVARTGRVSQGLIAGLLLGAVNGIAALEVAFRWSQEMPWFSSGAGALYVHLLPPLAGISLLLISGLCGGLVAARSTQC